MRAMWDALIRVRRQVESVSANCKGTLGQDARKLNSSTLEPNAASMLVLMLLQELVQPK